MDRPIPLKITSLSPLLLADELERSLQFYNSLGFQTAFVYDDFYACVEKDGFTIHLKCSEPNKEERESRRKKEDLDINLSVEQIEILYNAVQQIPVNIIQPLREMPYGKEFYIADPDGNVLGFVGEG